MLTRITMANLTNRTSQHTDDALSMGGINHAPTKDVAPRMPCAGSSNRSETVSRSAPHTKLRSPVAFRSRSPVVSGSRAILPLGRPLKLPNLIQLPTCDSKVQPLSLSFLGPSCKQKSGVSMVSNVAVMSDSSVSSASDCSRSTATAASCSRRKVTQEDCFTRSPKRHCTGLSDDEQLFVEAASKLSATRTEPLASSPCKIPLLLPAVVTTRQSSVEANAPRLRPLHSDAEETSTFRPLPPPRPIGLHSPHLPSEAPMEQT